MTCNHYGISYEDYFLKSLNLSSIKDWHFIECEINNKITLGDLCNNFKGEIWIAKNYNVLNHNCQYFAAEVIKILKAVRIHEWNKIRTKEKDMLPNCIISALWDNEKLSTVNTIGRIPIIGFFFDVIAKRVTDNPYKSSQ